MANFLLQPCKIRENRFVPTKDEAVAFDWADLCTRLAPSESVKAKSSLRRAESQGFIGLTRHEASGESCTFVFCNQDRSNSIDWLIKQDPSFPGRVLEVYRVESIDWEEIQLEERGTSKSRTAL